MAKKKKNTRIWSKAGNWAKKAAAVAGTIAVGILLRRKP